ncbi:MAG TPA: LemA family protein [Myxococcaceae bacterium]|jgi:LemA protein|nr:LemA family protein [Myxococcaceae bacterium]
MTTSALRPALLAAGALALVAGSGCQSYDELIAKDQVCEQKWADYQAALQRRADLVPNLVETVKAAAKQEQATLSAVLEARAKATSIQLSGADLEDPAKVAAFEKAQADLKGALSRLLVVQEAYPDLKSNQGFRELQAQLEGTENRILRAREQYNAAVAAYNTELKKIRGSVIRKATGQTFKERVYFTATPQAQSAPQVKF